MFKHIVVSISLVIGTVFFTAPAEADTPNCVTDAEWNAAYKTADRRSEVHAIFDTTGALDWDFTFTDYGYPSIYLQHRSYPRCNSDQRYEVEYSRIEGENVWRADWY